ncbi:DNA repair protein RecN [Jeotgalibaca ciconiae]|uniref:DNA repair protein RecN n=1 Tax=Jeotgalibaca ciconiae TaxID=2496265 RepID=A0A3S9HDS8_9LACT|nr:DNA repair protein RecN [Jeotgalibaca ciconiae]AZP05491.1 DNA repair protein RecN [Jeotgalibaca ciconiae]
MLQELSIKNFAIIDNLEISFDNGMTVLTGETGAGKSIIIDAVGLLAGGRGSADLIRHGEEKTILQGLFSLPDSVQLSTLLEEYGIENSGDQIILQRELSRNGKNVARVNGSIVTVAILREIANFLIDIHGQNEHQELMNPQNHLYLLDQFSDEKTKKQLAAYRQNYHSYQVAQEELKKLQSDEQQNIQRIDLLKFQIDEIEQANLQDNEEEFLSEERSLLANYQRIQEGLTNAYRSLQGEEGNALDQVGVSMESLEKIQDFSPNYSELFKNISEAYYQLEDSIVSIRSEIDDMSYDEGRLNEIELRLEVIHQLKRKYGQSITEIKKYYEQIIVELDMISNKESYIARLTKTFEREKSSIEKTGKALSKMRREIAEKLEIEIQKQLKELYMEKAQFKVIFNEEKTAIHSNGLDVIEFYISTNVGEPLKPLTKIASGGELSRMMLALKAIFTQTQGITSIIFDEVDTGVSGRVAQAIANKIHLVAEHSQVLCISHLPQVAAMADHHFYIEKEVSGNRTKTHITNIEENTRVMEIARMLAGSDITELSIAHARELLDLAKK